MITNPVENGRIGRDSERTYIVTGLTAPRPVDAITEATAFVRARLAAGAAPAAIVAEVKDAVRQETFKSLYETGRAEWLPDEADFSTLHFDELHAPTSETP